MRSRWRGPGLVLSLVVGALLATSLSVGGSTPTPGRHEPWSRFTTADGGYPPQPVGARDVRPVEATPRSAFAGTADPVGVARQDPAVAERLGPDAVLIGVEARRSEGVDLVTWHRADTAETVVATVARSGVTGVEVVPGGEWQPPLAPEEGDRAIAIAREHWREAGEDRVDELEGFVMHTLDRDGTYPDHRLAYATFAAHVDARPELLAVVDLTTGEVVRTGVEDGQPSPAEPTHLLGQEVQPGPPREGSVEWGPWEFDYAVSGRFDGVSMDDVTYGGVPILKRASMPVMTVFYEGDACPGSPFNDRLGGELFPVEWADDAEIVLREFTLAGEQWLELGILDVLGEYVLYQSFYLSADGHLDSHTFAKGIQCSIDHEHYPFWRLDLDVAGADGDQLLRRTEAGEVVEPVEIDAAADEAVDHGWAVRDTTTGDRVEIRFDDGTWNVPGEVVPQVLYETNVLHARAFDPREDGTWRLPAVRRLPDNDGDAIDGEDLVVWYVGYLPHLAEEGPELWHSTGVRLTVDLAPRHYQRLD